MNLQVTKGMIAWWQENGNINVDLLEKVIDAKNREVKKSLIKKHLNVRTWKG